MIVWTEPALWAEVAYRRERVRHDVAPRRRRWRAPEAAIPVAPPAPPIPVQRTAGPGERVPVGCASAPERR